MFRRCISIMMSVVMMAAAFASPVQALGAETKAEDAQEKSKNEVFIPKTAGIDIYPEKRDGVKEGSDGSRKFSCEADEKVRLSLSIDDTFEMEQIQVLTGEKRDIPMEWVSETQICFMMPDENVRVEAILHVKQTESPETAQGSQETPSSKEDDGASAAAEPENAVTDEGQSAEAIMDASDGTAEADKETASGMEHPEEEKTGKGTEEKKETEEKTEEKAEEKPQDIPEVSAGEEQETADTPETEYCKEDGFPEQGSVFRLEELVITTTGSFTYETSFDECPYPQETCTVCVLSDEICYGIPGSYDVLYRVDESGTGRFWYLVRPVRIDAEKPEKETAGQEAEAGDDQELTDEEDEDPLPGEDSPAAAYEDEASPDPDGQEKEASSGEMEEASSGEETEAETGGDEETENQTEISEGEDSIEETEEPEEETEIAPPEEKEVYTVFFAVDDDYQFRMNDNNVSFTEGEEVSFQVRTDETHEISEVTAALAIVPEDADGEELPILETAETVKVEASDENDDQSPEEYSFVMPASDVVLSAAVALAAASTDVEVQLENGGIKNIPKAWTPDGMTWASGRTVIGYTRYRRVTMPDGKERVCYCLQPFVGADEDGTYTAEEIKKSGKISATEAATLRKALFYLYGGPGWSTGEIKDMLSVCEDNGQYYTASHYILSKIYCDATSGNWNVAISAGYTYDAVNKTGEAAINKIVAAIKKMDEPTASLSTTQVSGTFDAAAGYAKTQGVKYTSNVNGNDLTVTVPTGVTMVVGSKTYAAGQEATVKPGETFSFRKSGYSGAHTQNIKLKAAIMTDYDAYLIKVSADKQNMGFSYVAEKSFTLAVNWPDLFTHLSVYKKDSVTGSSTPSAGYSMDGAVYGIYADEEKKTLLESVTIKNGKAVSKDQYQIGQTYYIAEISPPAGYEMDKAIYSVKAAADGSAAVSSAEDPKRAPVMVEKHDAVTGNGTGANKEYSLEGAVYGLYSDSACTQELDRAVIGKSAEETAEGSDQNNTGRFTGTYLAGTYYVKEISPPSCGLYDKDGTVYTAEVTLSDVEEGNVVKIISEDPVLYGAIGIQKIDLDTGEAKPMSRALNFEGAVFGIYTDEKCEEGTEKARVTTDANGYAETGKDLLVQDYYVKELTAPAGYTRNEKIFTVTAGEMADSIRDGKAMVSLTVEDRIIRGNVQIMKVKTVKGMYEEVAEGVEFVFTYTADPSVSFTVVPGRENTIITDREGCADTQHKDYPFGTLIYGEWEITEQNTPEGYEPIDPLKIMIEGDGRTLRYVANNRQIHAAILIEKRDEQTGCLIPVSGVRFSILKEGEKVRLFNSVSRAYESSWTTGDDGMVQLPDTLSYGTYTLQEDPDTLPEGYMRMEDFTFKVEKMADDTLHPFVLTAKEPPQTGTIRIEKQDALSQDALGGFEFEITVMEDIVDASGTVREGEDADGNQVLLKAGTLVDRLETGTDGTALSRDLYLGTYQVRESRAAEGYAITPEDRKVILDASPALARKGEAVSRYVLFQDYPTSLYLKKTCAKTGSVLEGITFRVKTEEEPDDDGQLFITDKNGWIRCGHLKHNTGYVVTEVETIPGYNLSDETVTFTVDENGLIDGSWLKEITMENIPNEVHITKTDITNGEEIPGAHLQITDSDGNVVEEWDSTEEAHIIYALPAGEYTLTEITAPDGYELSESISFTVTDTLKVQGAAMEDSPYREIEVSKTDITQSAEIPGATLTITTSEGGLVERWISEETAHKTKLPSGSYILTEEIPAPGYVTAESIPFTVVRTSAEDYEVMGITMVDDITTVKITKSDITTGEEIAGAELVIHDTDGNEVERWISTQEAHYIEMLPIGSYTLTEITAPDGYATSEVVSFEVTDTKEIQPVEMKDQPLAVDISKKDIADGEGGKELPGARLIVRDESGRTIDEWTSTKTPHRISHIKAGKYTLTEVTAPYGYDLAETVAFEVKDSRVVQTVTMYDAPKEEKVDLTGKRKRTTYGPTYTPGPSSSIVAPVKTGDDTPLLVYAMIALMAAAGILFGIRRIRGKRRA